MVLGYFESVWITAACLVLMPVSGCSQNHTGGETAPAAGRADTGSSTLAVGMYAYAGPVIYGFKEPASGKVIVLDNGQVVG